jgi:hypothetical protein
MQWSGIAACILGLCLYTGSTWSPSTRQAVVLKQRELSLTEAIDQYRSAAIQDAQQAQEAAKAKKWLDGEKASDPNFRRADELFRLSTSLRKAASAIRAAKARQAGIGAMDDEWVNLADEVQYDLREISPSRDGIPKQNIFPAFAAPLKAHMFNAMGSLQLPFQAL